MFLIAFIVLLIFFLNIRSLGTIHWLGNAFDNPILISHKLYIVIIIGLVILGFFSIKNIVDNLNKKKATEDEQNEN